jgi:hypothetical protein
MKALTVHNNSLSVKHWSLLVIINTRMYVCMREREISLSTLHKTISLTDKKLVEANKK